MLANVAPGAFTARSVWNSGSSSGCWTACTSVIVRGGVIIQWPPSSDNCCRSVRLASAIHDQIFMVSSAVGSFRKQLMSTGTISALSRWTVSTRSVADSTSCGGALPSSSLSRNGSRSGQVPEKRVGDAEVAVAPGSVRNATPAANGSGRYGNVS